jgi:CheY-like chemotaxis protein
MIGQQGVLAIVCDWRIRKLIRANLEAVGLQVQEAVSGPHGLQLLQTYRPELILLDMDLPEEDAFRLMEVLQGQLAGKRLAIVVMSNEPAGRWMLDHEQVVSCLRKPFSAVSLLEQVQKALKRTQSGE